MPSVSSQVLPTLPGKGCLVLGLPAGCCQCVLLRSDAHHAAAALLRCRWSRAWCLAASAALGRVTLALSAFADEICSLVQVSSLPVRDLLLLRVDHVPVKQLVCWSWHG